MTDASAAPAPRCAYLSSLSLRRFRSHESLDLALGPAPIAIFGPNGAGKTNILEAVSLLTPGRGLRGAKTEELAGRPDPIGWSVKGRLIAAGEPVEIAAQTDLRPGAADRGKRRVAINGAPATQTALAGAVSALWLTPAMDRLWIEGAAERRRFLDRLTLAFEPRHGAASAEYERAMRERNRLLRDEIAPPEAWIDALESRMGRAGEAVFRARRAAVEALSAAQADGETAFPKAELALVPAEGAPLETAAALQQAFGRSRRRDAAAGRCLVGPHRDDLEAVYAAKGVEARQASTGEQKALLISIVLAAARALTARGAPPPLLLLDEVAAHLDDGRRAALYEEILGLGLQAWLTGTGPELFEALGSRAQRLSPPFAGG